LAIKVTLLVIVIIYSLQTAQYLIEEIISNLFSLHYNDKNNLGLFLDIKLQIENIIEKNLRSFYEVGIALLKIRESELYLLTHTSFEEYCHDRWEISRTHAFYLIKSSKIVNNLVSCSIIEQKRI